MKYQDCYEEGRRLLAEAGMEEAALDARLLLEYICHTSRNDLLAHGDREVEADRERDYFQLIGKRAEHIPLQHLTGSQDFMGLSFAVSNQVLIPRQDTEILVEEVLKELHDGMRILDMCTGSGCILLSLLHYSNGCQGVGADISAEALKIAGQNAESILGKCVQSVGISGVSEMAESVACEEASVTFVESDLFEQIKGKFDIIVSNPPYIRTSVIETLMPEVREHEPRQALDGKEDGLYFYRRILAEGREHLEHGGMLYFEIGYDQGEAVGHMMTEAGFSDVEVVQDYAGLDRVVYGILY